MSRWYSRRGARRGLLIAAFAAALWIGWAVGYIHGSRLLLVPDAAVRGKHAVAARGMAL